MKIHVGPNSEIVLGDVFNAIVIRTDHGDFGIAQRTKKIIFPKRDQKTFFWKLVPTEIREKVFGKSYPTLANFPKKVLTLQEAWKQNLTAEESRMNGEFFLSSKDFMN